jgi:uncharacterized protein YegP (UPF0339 family)
MANALGLTFHIFPGKNGDLYWWLASRNNRSIAVSGEGYKNLQDCKDAINLVASSDGAPIVIDKAR